LLDSVDLPTPPLGLATTITGMVSSSMGFEAVLWRKAA
jgi:hypothetical protein